VYEDAASGLHTEHVESMLLKITSSLGQSGGHPRRQQSWATTEFVGDRNYGHRF